MLAEEFSLRGDVGALGGGHFECVVERWHFRNAPSSPSDFINAEVSCDGKDPACDSRPRAVVSRCVPPDPDECFLYRLFSILFSPQNAKRKGEALPVKTVIEHSEGVLLPGGDERNKVEVIGKPIVTHGKKIRRWNPR